MTLTYVPEIIEHPSPNYSKRKAGVRVDTVLLHHTASDNNDSTLRWLCTPASGVSAHYLVTTGGLIWRLVPESLKAWHAGEGHLPWEKGPWKRKDGRLTDKGYDFNHRSIGIEIVNPGDGKTPFTEAQYRALEWLVPDIVRRLGWKVAPVAAGLVGGSAETLRIVRHFIGADGGCVLGHRDVAPGRKTDPADNFDWERIRAALMEGRT